MIAVIIININACLHMHYVAMPKNEVSPFLPSKKEYVATIVLNILVEYCFRPSRLM